MKFFEMNMQERTVGVVECNSKKMQNGYNLMCAGKETYLLDYDGRVVHMWRSRLIQLLDTSCFLNNILLVGSCSQHTSFPTATCCVMEGDVCYLTL